MNPETAAQLALLLYAGLAVLLVLRQIARSRQRVAVWFLYAAERLYVPLMFRWRSNRTCPFPEEGPGLIIANHRSPVDPLMIWMGHHLGYPSGRVRVISFMMAREYYEITGVGWICRTMNSIPLGRHGRDMGPVKAALDHLQNGDLVAIFPEGRINLGEGLLPAGTGVAWLALTAQVPVYPVFIHNSPQGRSMIAPFYTFSHVKVSYGEPIDLSEYHGRKKTQKLLREVTDLMMHRLADLGGVRYRDENAYSDIDLPPSIPLQQATG